MIRKRTIKESLTAAIARYKFCRKHQRQTRLLGIDSDNRFQCLKAALWIYLRFREMHKDEWYQ